MVFDNYMNYFWVILMLNFDVLKKKKGKRDKDRGIFASVKQPDTQSATIVVPHNFVVLVREGGVF